MKVSISVIKEDPKGNQNNFHILGSYKASLVGDILNGLSKSSVLIHVSSYVSKSKYDLGCEPNESTQIVLTPENSAIDFTSTVLTNETLASEVAKQFGGDGTEYIIEDV